MQHRDFASMQAKLAKLRPRQKQYLTLPVDAVLMAFSVWAAFSMRLGTFWPAPLRGSGWLLIVIVPIIGMVVYHQFGVYRLALRSLESRGAIRIGQASVALAMILAAGAYFFSDVFIPRSTPIIFAFLLIILALCARMMIREVYKMLIHRGALRSPVLIYGAGSSGIQLATALNSSSEYRVVGFIDDDMASWGRFVGGNLVSSPDNLDQLLQKFGVRDVLMAMPSISRTRRREILMNLSDRQLHVRTIPSMVELVAGFQSVDKLREVEVDELLGRDAVDPMDDLFDAVRGKAVLVTGAGGSIGSELCRQALAKGAQKLILYELSEFALYKIERELRRDISAHGATLYAILGSVCDEKLLIQTLKAHAVDTLFHAAAYKHVPLVEANPIEGVRNNTLGSLAVARAVTAAGTPRAVLISTDKAVRPTNVMGASKRLAERVFVEHQKQAKNTTFSIVRFGNVMGSSGSVIPLFQTQIAAGGPVTVTDPQVTRYFMTIPEAAQLVIQASSLSGGGDLYLLDMGKPVLIDDLARRMINLSGATVKDANNPDGEIEIVFTGLRPGEKLYEELLIEAEAMPTPHPKIFRAIDGYDNMEFEPVLDALSEIIEERDEQKLINLLHQTVEQYGRG